jgi:hypothetical protein
MLRMVKKSYADTSALSAQLLSSTWNTIPFRTENPLSPHREVSDIWVRYNPIENYHGDMREFNSEHVSRWYEVANEIPEAKRLSEQIANDYHAHRLGAVLITKIPAGKTCYPHIDQGWHARYYEKFALQVSGNLQQSFSVEDETLRTESGDLFWFDNSRLHWVLNPSTEDRITMIVCLRRH